MGSNETVNNADRCLDKWKPSPLQAVSVHARKPTNHAREPHKFTKGAFYNDKVRIYSVCACENWLQHRTSNETITAAITTISHSGPSLSSVPSASLTVPSLKSSDCPNIKFWFKSQLSWHALSFIIFHPFHSYLILSYSLLITPYSLSNPSDPQQHTFSSCSLLSLLILQSHLPFLSNL